jgi:putative tricarboxylic transport membrane protein
MTIEMIGNILTGIFSLHGGFLLTVGVFIGILGGALPGISTTMTVALLSTLCYSMKPLEAVLFLAATQVGSTYGGSISATVLNIPGTPASAATAIEGSPLTKKGEGAMALSINAISSVVGNTIGALLLLFTMPLLTALTMNFLSYEMFWFSIFGVVICAQLSKGNFIKGLLAAVLGMLLGTVGLDPIYGSIRLTLGIKYLNDGIALIPAMIGIFGMSEVFNYITNSKLDTYKITKGKFFYWKEWWHYKWLTLRASLLGFLIGALPGLGANIASWVGYDHAKSTSKNPNLFGKGAIDGLVGSESANNACVPGAYAPLLSLGIPGDGVTAIILGVLMVQGVQPGPTFIIKNPEWLYELVLAFLISGVLFLLIGTFIGRGIIKCLVIPLSATMSVVALLCVVGAYGYQNRVQDIYLMFVFGIIGWLMNKNSFPIAPMILGLLLSGSMVDRYLRRGFISSKGNYSIFFTRPISVILIIALLFVIYKGFIAPIVKKKNPEKR